MGEEYEKIPERKIKETGKMFKALKGAASAAGPLGMVFQALEVLSPILEAFEPILDAVGALFDIMAANIIPQLIEVMKPFLPFAETLSASKPNFNV